MNSFHPRYIVAVAALLQVIAKGEGRPPLQQGETGLQISAERSALRVASGAALGLLYDVDPIAEADNEESSTKQEGNDPTFDALQLGVANHLKLGH